MSNRTLQARPPHQAATRGGPQARNGGTPSAFSALGLSATLAGTVADAGYTQPTPIQSGSIPAVLSGRDLLGMAQTGTGKTAAFALPIIDRLSASGLTRRARSASALVLAPTRELALQIASGFRQYGRDSGTRVACIYGGVGQANQVADMARGTDVLVACPGRLLDLASQGHVDLSHTGIFVLDEADRMLDMGFARDIARISAMLPAKRQVLLFSATMPAAIETMARSMLRDPVRVEVSPPSSAAGAVTQSVMFVSEADKDALLRMLVARPGVERSVVFTLQKHTANKVAESLRAIGIPAEAIHGNKSQAARQRAMDGFRSGEVAVLVATDIASRGIDVDGVTHVFQYDLPSEPEAYVHRIGRTARAGATGAATSLCDPTQRAWLRQVERLLGVAVPVDRAHPYHSEAAANSTMPPPVLGGRGGPGRPRGGPPAGTRPHSREVPRKAASRR